MGAFVVYDPYWDPVYAYADEEEALRQCQPTGKHAGCHVIFKNEVEPGDCADMPYVPKPWDD